MAEVVQAEHGRDRGDWEAWLRRGVLGLLLWVVASIWFGADAGWRERSVVPVLVVAGVAGWPLVWRELRGVGGVRWVWLGMAVAGGAGFVGGVTGAAGLRDAAWTLLAWVAGVVGVAAMLGALTGRARVVAARGITVLFGLLLAASLAGYVADAERWMLTEWTGWGALDRRLALIWPCRWWSAGEQRIWWEHPNIGAWIFACGFGLCLEGAWRRFGSGWRAVVPLLLLAVVAVCLLFLTASRAGLVLALVLLPVVLFGRTWKWWACVAGVVAAGLAAGWILLENKVPPVTEAVPPSAKPPPAVVSPPAPVKPPRPPADMHIGGLVERRDAGRLSGYRKWASEEMPGHWQVGHGVMATGKPLPGGLPHEHSMWVATVRGGGLWALAGQLLVLGAAGLAGLRVAREAGRACLVLWLATVAGFLFDRTTVFRTTATLEFFAHWTAVWLPFFALARRRPMAEAPADTTHANS